MHGRSLALALPLLLAACGEDDPGPTTDFRSTGGAVATGGAAMGTGGLATATGGAPGTGAATSGGMATGGQASGGDPTGGAGTGGLPGTGGAATGGATSGGVPATGGALPTGGATTGGLAGGAATGGTSSGGLSGAGGTATGGASTGGFAGTGGWLPAGGANTGGFAGTGGWLPTGGANTGGTNEGGLADTGGAETGGTNEGGAGGAASDCPAEGHVTYTLDRAPNPTPDQQSAYEAITAAMDHAVEYYNCYTNIEKELFVSYNPDVQTADGNVNGSIRFGSRASMQFVTAAHEIAHTVGIAYYGFADLAPDDTKIWTGPIAVAKLREITGDPAAVLYADNTHFWPYGLNYETEYESEADLINHCLMVVAIRADLGL